MTSHNVALRIRNWVAGLALSLGAVTPALAASLDPRLVPMRDLLLVAALVLLAVALGLRIMRRRDMSDMSGPAPEGPDLRWWKN
jgi:hypothetical protein